VTYAEHLSLMTRALVDVARHGQHQLTDAERDVALFSRRVVLDLLTGVHTDLTGLQGSSGVPRIDDLEAHPVAALDRALARHPRVRQAGHTRIAATIRKIRNDPHLLYALMGLPPTSPTAT
jgi:hypothetical protein